MSRPKSRTAFDSPSDEERCRCFEWYTQAWDELVHRTPGISAQEIAAYVGVGVGELYRFCYPPWQEGHRCAKGSYIVLATWATGNAVILNAMVQKSGMTTPRRRKPSKNSDEKLLSRAFQHLGELIGELGDAVGDALVERPEAKRKIQKHLRQIREDADEFYARLDASPVQAVPRSAPA